MYLWSPEQKLWLEAGVAQLNMFMRRPAPVEFNNRYKDELIHKISVATQTGTGPTGFPEGQKGISDRYDMVRAAMLEYDMKLCVLMGLSKYSPGQKVRIDLNAHIKKVRYGWVDSVSTIGGYCGASGVKVESGEHLYYVRMKQQKHVRPFLYTFCEAALTPMLEKASATVKFTALAPV